MRLDASRCLVVGGARRLGRELALGLAAGGAAVCVSSRELADADALVPRLEQAGAPRAAAVAGDVRAPSGAAALVGAATEELGGLDALVFAASGPFAPRRPEQLDEAAWDASMDTVAKGFFFAACAAYGAFTETERAAPGPDTPERGRRRPEAPTGGAERGVIVAITDYLGLQPWAAFAAHAAAKAAQIHLVKELARAWAADGVRVCGVAPGPVDLADDEHRAATLRAAARAEAERLVTPAQVVAALRLCLENQGMTGVNVVVDAGSLLG